MKYLVFLCSPTHCLSTSRNNKSQQTDAQLGIFKSVSHSCLFLILVNQVLLGSGVNFIQSMLSQQMSHTTRVKNIITKRVIE